MIEQMLLWNILETIVSSENSMTGEKCFLIYIDKNYDTLYKKFPLSFNYQPIGQN